MIYFKNDDGEIFAYEDDFPVDEYREGLTPMPRDEVDEMHARNKRERDFAQEKSWAAAEYASVENIILLIEDDDDLAPPGTVKEWREYRKALRRWDQDAEGFPSEDHRPARPQ